MHLTRAKALYIAVKDLKYLLLQSKIHIVGQFIFENVNKFVLKLKKNNSKK
jgi:hypothetical protein